MGLGNLLRSISSERIRKYLFQEGSNLPPRKYSTFFLLSSPRASTCTYLMHMKTCLVPIPTGWDYQSVRVLLCSSHIPIIWLLHGSFRFYISILTKLSAPPRRLSMSKLLETPSRQFLLHNSRPWVKKIPSRRSLYYGIHHILYASLII